MSNAKCLNLSHPIVKQNIKDISKQLGLQDSTISLNEYKAIVRAFSIYKGIENEDVLDYIGSQEYDDFLNDYFNIGKSIEFRFLRILEKACSKRLVDTHKILCCFIHFFSPLNFAFVFLIQQYPNLPNY